MLGRLMRRKSLLGLDIGSTMIKAVSLERRHGRLALRQAALAGTPPGVVTEGAMTDGVTVARSVKALCADYGIPERRIAAAVGGEKCVCQSDEAPSGDDLAEFVRERAAAAVSYPVAAACCGYQVCDPAKPNEVLWVSTPSEVVDWMRETISLAGKRPAVVTPQACALANAYSYNHEPASTTTVLLVNVGSRVATVALVRGWTIRFARDAAIAREWPADERRLPDRVAGAIERYADVLRERARPYEIERLYVAGGAARSDELKRALGESTSLKIEELNPFRRVSYSADSAEGKAAVEHGPSLAIAAGLALEAFEDL